MQHSSSIFHMLPHYPEKNPLQENILFIEIGDEKDAVR